MGHLIVCTFLLLGVVPKSSSQVAWSPEADFPKKSDLPRGGDSRPDISQLKDYGLVDSYLDSGAGEGEGLPQTAPVTVFSDQMEYHAGDHESDLKSFDSSQNHPLAPERAEEAAYPGAANHPGREEYSTPALPGDSSVVFIELPSDHAPDTLWLSYWPEFLKEQRALTPGITLPLTPTQGNFFEGNAGFKRYSVVFPAFSSPISFSLRNKRNYLFRYWTLNPGTQIRIRVDLEKGRMLFMGPSAPFFQAQYALTRMAEEQQFQAHPLMVTTDPDRILSDSLTDSLYQTSLALPNAVFPPMQFLLPSSPPDDLLDSLLRQSPSSDPAFKWIAGLGNDLSSVEKYQLEQKAWGEILLRTLPKMNLGRESLSQSEYREKFESWISAIPLPDSQWIDPVLLTGLNELILLRTQVRDQSLLEGTADLSSVLRERILGIYLLDNYKRLERGRDSLVRRVRENIESPWIADLIGDLDSKNAKGSPFYSGELLGLEGEPVSLEAFRGKSLVLTFWISGCKFCMKYYQRTLKPVFEHFRHRSDVQFIAINADRSPNSWKENALSDTYSHPDMLQLHEDSGQGILSYYKISAFPQKILLGPEFTIEQSTQTQYSPAELIRKIEEMTGNSANQLETNPK
ncbi:TlpA family protein disulfide reductase [Algoriphagus faecimaris]|uniref:TlpA family protein disulfide reductase n=1 Tax=Algoriphagus faecimaris TaxID=686796 RepID=UPI000B4449A1|nr:thioredoxin family protein [Algoriphagus faecimaris]